MSDRRCGRKSQSALLIPVGLFVAAIGFSVGVVWVWGFGLVCLLVGGLKAYSTVKKRSAAKRIAREEAEIRAHQLRQSRGGV
ncbi:hypothetical protein ERC79_09945 [Rhodococcus sp. ABRD24]|uniref:hypothetical protein n=1 Tax=Rhodococcus sp. ABRD24 TaxID=2507582 RepID=UPI00103AB3E0|nr:hypothetical protein [Rhodococcus sp. ABRD24]QBJ96252.1 hypothetical protein ERC79_09945 [Rhodococcus sp. ABRD24]